MSQDIVLMLKSPSSLLYLLSVVVKKRDSRENKMPHNRKTIRGWDVQIPNLNEEQDTLTLLRHPE